MMSLLAMLLPLVGGAAGLISLVLHGLKYLAGKTKNHVDDDLVNALLALDPSQLAALLDKVLGVTEGPGVQQKVPAPPVPGKVPAVLGMAPDELK